MKKGDLQKQEGKPALATISRMAIGMVVRMESSMEMRSRKVRIGMKMVSQAQAAPHSGEDLAGT